MSTAPQTNIASELHAAVADALASLAEKIAGTVVSPRLKLLDIEQVCTATGLSDRTIYTKISEGKFPKPIEGIGKNKWRESTLIAWMDAHDPDAGRNWKE